jgi:hypothetical protein
MNDQFEENSSNDDSAKNQYDRALDSRIAEMFHEGFANVKPSESFRERLKQKLTDQLSDQAVSINKKASSEFASVESASPINAPEPIVPEQIVPEQIVEPPAKTNAGPLRRLSLGFVAAAAAVLMLILWPARPVYSFDKMRERLSDEAFLRVNFQEDGQAFVGWVSSDGRFAAVESSRSVAWAINGTNASFDRASGQARSLLDSDSIQSTQVRALRVLDALQGNNGAGLRVINESWQRIDLSGGADGILRVSFAGKNSNQPELNASFGVDSSTGLPVWIDLDDAPVKDSIDAANHPADSRMPLAYPRKGPTQLSSFGIPNHWASAISGGPAQPITASLSTRKSHSEENPIDTNAALSNKANEAQNKNEKATSQERKVSENFLPSRRPESPLITETAKDIFVATEPTRTWPEPIPVDVPTDLHAMADRIDDRLLDVLNREGIKPAPAADAPTLFRRMHLDLTGRIPHVAEIRQSLDAGKFDVAALISEILDSPDFDSNMASIWVRWLLPPDVELEQFGGKAALQAWLADQFEARIAYSDIVRDLLTAQGRVGDRGPVLFTTGLEMKPDHLAKQTARTFLGTRIDCAMCHDHPYDTWTQTDFWGYASLFARISRPQGKMNAMSSVLQVKDVGDGEVTFPDTEIVVKPRLLGGGLLNEPPESNQRRQQLADWITNPGNRQFARATVNLVWSHFFGAGLVHPRDDFGTHNPALSPELLEELAVFFIQAHYDVRSLVSAIVLSDAYQRSSRTEADSARPMFESMPIRWLTAEQLFDCLLVASGGLGDSNVSLDPSLGLNRINNTARDTFVQQFGSNSDSVLEYQAGIPQALSMMNGTLSNLSAGEDTSRLLQGLRAPFFSDSDRIETVFLSLVGRPPSQRELETVLRMLKEAGANATGEVLSDLVWALLNSAEFATNH